jgi:hypothetical protein
MSTEDEKEEKRGFKVEDRRRFSETGEARPNQPEERPEPAPSGVAGTAAGAQAPQREMPPFDINFSTFIISLSTQALAHLGEIPHPIDNQVAVDLGAAKQLIDILGILKDKTKGNLDTSESGLLDSVLYDLRLKYVERVRAHAGQTGS